MIASWINGAIEARDQKAVLARIRSEVRELCEKFPLYPSMMRNDA